MAFEAVIFEVDGVLVDPPQQRAFRETLVELAAGPWRELAQESTYAPERFTQSLCQRLLAGKAGRSAARAVLVHFRFSARDVDERAQEYADAEQAKLTSLVDAGEFFSFPDAVRFALCARAVGLRIAAASSSGNEEHLLGKFRVDRFLEEMPVPGVRVPEGATLLELFQANAFARPWRRGEPDPEIFLAAASALGVSPRGCLVVEDAVAGVEAAKAAGMSALAIARRKDESLLLGAGADRVVATLDEVAVDPLSEGRLELRRAAA